MPFATALHYLTHAKSTLVRWAVRPATLSLQAWARRADVTADRAGLLCARDLDVSQSALGKIADASDSRVLDRRRRALARFAASAYYKTVVGSLGESAEATDEGESQEDCDNAVARILDDKEG